MKYKSISRRRVPHSDDDYQNKAHTPLACEKIVQLTGDDTWPSYHLIAAETRHRIDGLVQNCSIFTALCAFLCY